MNNVNVPKFVVLLSSWNGERYIIEQIDSILSQINVNVELIVRDDGSKDGTLSILEQYKNLPNVTVLKEENIGVVASFLKLIDMAPYADYYALADQDDIWHKDKLCKAYTVLKDKNNSKPLLYGANKNLVDANRIFMGIHFDDNISDLLEFMGVVYLNYIAGCTMVFNNPMLDVFKNKKNSRDIAYLRMHDVWMMFMAHIYGEFIYDASPVMEYRRHGNNVSDGGVGIKIKGVQLYLNKIKNFIYPKNKKMIPSKTALKLLEHFDDKLMPETKNDLRILADYQQSISSKIRLLLNMKRINKTIDNNFVYAMKVIFNRL